jgi:AbrB family looped-hinge helix DNA binding protein
MKVTVKDQVTIPKNIREILKIVPDSEVDFIEENGRVYLIKAKTRKRVKKFNKLRGVATVKMTTDEIMALTRNNA